MLAEAVCEALDERAMVRWPNDVLVDGRKLAGVLPEVRGGQLMAGIGDQRRRRRRSSCRGDARVPADLAAPARAARPVDRGGVLAAVLARSSGATTRFERHGFTGLDRNELRGRRVRLAGGAEGTCDGVDGEGRLVVDGVPHTSAEVERVDAD